MENKTKTQGKSFLFVFSSKNGIYDVFCFFFIHSLINLKSSERVPTEFEPPVKKSDKKWKKKSDIKWDKKLGHKIGQKNGKEIWQENEQRVGQKIGHQIGQGKGHEIGHEIKNEIEQETRQTNQT